MNLKTKEHRSFLYFIIALAIMRLTLAPFVGLGVDEAHYVLYALNLDLSYFDHPPLVGWTQYIFTAIFGDGEFGARVAAIFIGTLSSIFIYKLIYDINKSTNEAFVAILALSASFLFNALFLMLMPDTLLFLLILPIIFTTIEIEKNNRLSAWLLLGVLLGLAGLAKYTAILFIVPIILYVIIKKRYDLFLTPKLLVAIALASLMILPVLIWNIQNDFSSLAYQSSHVVGSDTINWSGFLTSLLSQLGAYNPLLAPLAFLGLYKALRSKNSTLFLTALFGLVLILFFTYASLYKTALPHWSALFYMLFIPIGSYYFLKISKTYLKIAIGFGLFLSLLAYGELGFKVIPFKDYNSLHRDIYGWDKIMQEANKEALKSDIKAIAVTNWTLASRAIYYNRSYSSEVYLLDARDDQFDVWQKHSPLGEDIMIINTYAFKKEIDKYMKCDKVILNESFDIILNSSKVNTIELITCKNYQGLR